MIAFHEAYARLLESAPRPGTASVPLAEACGRILREAVRADRPQPACDRVMMDGHALRAADWENGIRTFRVVGQAPAGRPAALLPNEAGLCLETMTGAPCPRGADSIVPVEDSEESAPGQIRLRDGARVTPGRYLHRAGSDAAAGQVVAEAGRVVDARVVGLAALMGQTHLTVARPPSILVVPTGDELVGLGQVVAAHQIRQSNGHALVAALTAAGWPATLGPVLRDEDRESREILAEMLAAEEWIILTGAVSKGRRDFLPAFLGGLGCQIVFHGIAQRPGKPAGCWVAPGGCLVVGLPGNPVSALTGLHSLVLPALHDAAGGARTERRVILRDPPPAESVLTVHLPVVLGTEGEARPAPAANSGDFIGLQRSSGFVTIPPGPGFGLVPYTPWG